MRIVPRMLKMNDILYEIIFYQCNYLYWYLHMKNRVVDLSQSVQIFILFPRNGFGLWPDWVESIVIYDIVGENRTQNWNFVYYFRHRYLQTKLVLLSKIIVPPTLAQESCIIHSEKDTVQPYILRNVWSSVQRLYNCCAQVIRTHTTLRMRRPWFAEYTYTVILLHTQLDRTGR